MSYFYNVFSEKLCCLRCHKGALQSAFTLIELSIVLVIIALIIGGILVGRDMISASAIRSQISQIEKYQTAANTFKSKLGYLPGDIPNPDATNFGFTSRGQYAGQGDGNSVIEGRYGAPAVQHYGSAQGGGETVMFWVDLSTARLIDAGFSMASATSVATFSGTAINNYFPSAKIGAGNFVYVWSGGASATGTSTDGNNYYGISIVQSVISNMLSSVGMTVQQAYAIDQKSDDGLPQSGNITAQYVNVPASYWGSWAGAASGSNGTTTAATAGSSSTCYDNGNVGGATQKYSITQNNGTGRNCALSIKFQ